MSAANTGGSVFSLKTKITTPLFEETKAYYRALFGLVTIEEWDDGADIGCILGFRAEGGEAFLEIYKGDKGDGFKGLSLQFRTADLAAFAASIRGHHAYEGPTKRPWGCNYLYLTDPNGIAIVVFEGGN